MEPTGPTYSIGELASLADVGVETIRYYERRGILPEPPRTPGGYRAYSAADRWRLDFIRRGKTLGFTLGEISTLLGDDEHRSVDDVRRVAERRLAQVEDDIAALLAQRDRLRRLVHTCAAGPDAECLELAAPPTSV